jgi:clathrin heavy chain
LDRAHQGIYTQLGILYAKYREDKLMEHIKLFWSRLNIPTLLDACKQNLHWTEAVFLYSHYDQYDQGVDILMSHSAECWRHDLFKETISHVSNTEVYYRAIDFYLSEHPLLLNDLLMDLVGQLDHSRVVAKLKEGKQDGGNLPLVQKYLLHVQRDNLAPVNEAINQMYVLEENWKGLRESIDAYNQFDQISLALQLEKHELVEFRRISAYLFKMNKKYERSIELSKKDRLWADAMECTAESKDQALAEKLITYFVDNKENECYAACLYTCYELIRPDVVLELAWRNNLMNFAMPFMIQSLREYDDKLNAINQRLEAQDKEAQEKKNAEAKNTQPAADMLHPQQHLLLMPPMPMGGVPMGGVPMVNPGLNPGLNPGFPPHAGFGSGMGPL